MDTPAAYSAFHGYSPATGEGGYTTSTAQREAISLRWTPTVDVGISGWIHSLLRRNRCHSELNEYWRAYLGLDNQVPVMNPAAKTEWDDASSTTRPPKGFGLRAVLPHCLALLAIGAALSLLAARSLRKL